MTQTIKVKLFFKLYKFEKKILKSVKQFLVPLLKSMFSKIKYLN